MDARDTTRMESGERTLTFNHVTENATQLATIGLFPVVALGISDTIKELKDATTTQSKDISGVAPNKQKLREMMGDCILIYSQRAMVSAALSNNTELSEEVDHALTYYTQGKAALGESRASATVKLLETKLAIFGLLVGDILIMRTAIAAFVTKKDAPTTEKQAKKVAGTDQVPPLLDKLDHYLVLEGNLIHSYFPKSKLAEGFDLTSKLIIHGGRHNPVSFHLEDALTGKPIMDGKVIKAKNLKLFVESDEEGLAHFDTCNSGKQKFIIEIAGYVTQTITAIVRRGVGVELVIKMESLTPPKMGL